MNRKGIKLLSAVLSLALAALLFCALVPCFHGLTAFQTAQVKRLFKTDPFHDEESEQTVSVPVAAAVGTNGYERNTFVGSRIQMECNPDYVELNLAVDDSGALVLADSYFDVGEKSVSANRVVSSLLKSTRRTSLLVNLAEYTDLNAVSALITGSSRFADAVVRGVDENSIEYARRYFPSHTLLCEYSLRSRLSLSEIKARGADGVYCSASLLSAHFVKKVHDAGLLLWVDCGGSACRTVKALSMAQQLDGLVTAKPKLAMNLQYTWNYEEFKALNS